MNDNQITKESNNEIEIWKLIQGYEGLYEVSNIGRVKSFQKNNSNKSKTDFTIINPFIQKKGYFRISLSKNSCRKKYLIHRLVAQAFIPNPNNLPQVNHKNNDKSNNKIENLEWMTNLDNTKHAWKNGFKNRDCYPRGEKHYLTKLNNEIVKEIKQNYIPYKFGPAKLSEKYKIKKGCIKNIIYGKSWKHVII